MRKVLPLVAIVCAASLALGACNQTEKPVDAVVEQKAVVLSMPTSPTDKDAWKKYLVSVVTANMQGVKSTRPYMYYVPGGTDEAAVADRANQLDNVGNVVARGVLPGNMMAFGGPDSAITAQLVVDAFASVQAGSFKDVVVLFIGASADAERVKQAMATSGADVRIVEAK